MKKIILLVAICFSLNSVNAQTWQTLFFDNFNRADGAIGSNYSLSPGGNISIGIESNEVKITSGFAGDNCIVYLLTGYIQDSIKMSCKLRPIGSKFRFSFGARHNNQYSLRAMLNAKTDSISIFIYDHIKDTSKTLARTKANFDSTKTYTLEYTLLNQNLKFKLIQFGTSNFVEANATDNTIIGTLIDWNSYHYIANATYFIDDYKIEKSGTTGIDYNESTGFTIFPNPATDILFFNFGDKEIQNATVKTYNALGNLVKTDILTNNNNQINISELKNGIYLIITKSGDYSTQHKLLIQR